MLCGYTEANKRGQESKCVQLTAPLYVWYLAENEQDKYFLIGAKYKATLQIYVMKHCRDVWMDISSEEASKNKKVNLKMIDKIWLHGTLHYDLANEIEKDNYNKLKTLYLLQNETTLRES